MLLGSLMTIASSWIILDLFENNQTVLASVGLKIFANLEHNKDGTAEICIIAQSGESKCNIYGLNNLPSPVTLGPIEMDQGVIDANEAFKVCVSNPNSPSLSPKCENATNGPEKEPEYVNIIMPMTTSNITPQSPIQLSIDRITAKLIEAHPSANPTSIKKVLGDAVLDSQSKGANVDQMLNTILQEVTQNPYGNAANKILEKASVLRT